jgi:cysteinyl-tRNA synthetase
MNITDVGHLVSDADTGEDKMEKGARRTGKSAWEIAEIYTQAFKNDLKHLNILEPTIWCKATEHIEEQIEMVKRIEENGYTYRTSDGIYFDTAKLDNYGYLGRLNIDGLRAGSRIDMGEKRNPTDFALWKFSPKDEQRQMEWESPWGVGFPGWHIECSAMSAKYLGSFFDIHCGGEDHISVHHSNEIAQTEACYGTRLANFWMHGYFLQLDSEKMAKSAGGFLRIQTFIDKNYDPMAYRYLCLTAHYRSHLNFTWESLDAASVALDRLRRAVYELQDEGNIYQGAVKDVAEFINTNLVNEFTDRMNNDLNVPRALAFVWEILKSDLPDVNKKMTILHMDNVLGLRLGEWEPRKQAVPEKILHLVEQRQQARREKRYQEADELRDQVNTAGYDIVDTPDGPVVKAK